MKDIVSSHRLLHRIVTSGKHCRGNFLRNGIRKCVKTAQEINEIKNNGTCVKENLLWLNYSSEIKSLITLYLIKFNYKISKQLKVI